MFFRFITFGFAATIAMLATGLRSQAGVVPYTPDADTVVLYHFDEPAGSVTAVDAAGNFDVTASSSPFADNPSLPGLGNSGGTFQSPSNLLSSGVLSQAQVDLFDTETFTIEAWVKDINLDFVPAGAFQYRDGGNSRVGLRFDGGRIALGIERKDGGGFEKIETSTPLSWQEDTWYHVAVTYDGDGTGNDSIVNFYRTGPDDPLYVANLIETVTGAPDLMPLTGGNSLHIGGNDGSSSRMFGDYIDELRYSNVVRDEFNVFVPEPSSALLALLGAGLLGCISTRRRTGRR